MDGTERPLVPRSGTSERAQRERAQRNDERPPRWRAFDIAASGGREEWS
jgi:hypothetical protein